MKTPPRGSYFCVINMIDGSQKYCGTNIGRAAAALDPGTHYEWGDTKDEAQRKAVRHWEIRNAMQAVSH